MAPRRKYVVKAATLTRWCDAFLQGGGDGIKSRTAAAITVEHMKDWLVPTADRSD